MINQVVVNFIPAIQMIQRIEQRFCTKMGRTAFCHIGKTNMGCENMMNVTGKIWNDSSLKSVDNKSEWLAFVNLFSNWSDNDFHT